MASAGAQAFVGGVEALTLWW